MQKLKDRDHATLISLVSSELEAIRSPYDSGVLNAINLPLQSKNEISSNRKSSLTASEKPLSLPVAYEKPYNFVGKYSSETVNEKVDRDSQSKEIRRYKEKSKYGLRKSESTLFESPMSTEYKFPPSCLKLMLSLPGNSRCVDCGGKNPEWASISYGVLLCVQCCGKHRGLGVQVSFVRSIHLDSWTHFQILAMLEGGNDQLRNFFHRHSFSKENSEDAERKKGDLISNFERRYETKAAQFYRDQLRIHVKKLMSNGEYKGREAARRTKSSKKSNRKSSDTEEPRTEKNQLIPNTKSTILPADRS